jgi:O-antigen ligase
MAHSWLGYGFNASWMQGESSSVLQQVNWLVKDADNGFINLVLDLGLLGLSILLAGYLVFWRRALRLLRGTTGVAPIWALVFLYNLTVGRLLAQNNILWILYVSIAVGVSLESTPRRIPLSLDRRS